LDLLLRTRERLSEHQGREDLSLDGVPVEEAIHEGDGSEDGGGELKGGDVSFDLPFGFEAEKNEGK